MPWKDKDISVSTRLACYWSCLSVLLLKYHFFLSLLSATTSDSFGRKHFDYMLWQGDQTVRKDKGQCLVMCEPNFRKPRRGERGCWGPDGNKSPRFAMSSSLTGMQDCLLPSSSELSLSLLLGRFPGKNIPKARIKHWSKRFGGKHSNLGAHLVLPLFCPCIHEDFQSSQPSNTAFPFPPSMPDYSFYYYTCSDCLREQLVIRRKSELIKLTRGNFNLEIRFRTWRKSEHPAFNFQYEMLCVLFFFFPPNVLNFKVKNNIVGCHVWHKNNWSWSTKLKCSQEGFVSWEKSERQCFFWCRMKWYCWEYKHINESLQS